MTSPEPPSAPRRLREIVAVLKQHSFIANFRHQTHPEEIVAALAELGPTFIKLGQVLSTRPDLVSSEYIHALQRLQDQVPPDDYQTVAATYQAATGHSIAQGFLSFDHQPFASASIGQCHHARLKDGTAVVVKIQHQAVRQLVQVDLELFSRAVALIKYVPRREEDLAVVNLPEVVDQLSAALKSELDTKQEVANGERFYRLNDGQGPFWIPWVDPKASADRVLVTQAMPGKSIKGLLQDPPTVALPKGLDATTLRQQVAHALVQNFIKQIFVDHYFHADPHPGNLLYTLAKPETELMHRGHRVIGGLDFTWSTSQARPPYRLIYLDFGMMGTLTPSLTAGTAQLLMAIAAQDHYAISQAVLGICNQTGPVDEQGFNRALGNFLTPYLRANLAEINFGTLVFEITALCRKFHLQVKPEATLVLRAFATLEGTVARLDPTLSLMQVARPFTRWYLSQHFHPREAGGALAYRLLLAGNALVSLPTRAAALLEQLTNGEQQLTLHYRGQEALLRRLERLVNRFLTVLVLSAVILASAILVAAGRDHPIAYRIGLTGYLLAIVVTIALVVANLCRWWRRHYPK